MEFVAGIVEGSTSRWRSYVALVIGLFLMILAANWLGLLPGVGTIGIKHGEELVPLVRPAAADLNFTLGLAIITFVVFVFWGVRLHGRAGLPQGAGRRAARTWRRSCSRSISSAS